MLASPGGVATVLTGVVRMDGEAGASTKWTSDDRDGRRGTAAASMSSFPTSSNK